MDWSYVEFVDNQDCLDLLEGKAEAPNQGIFPIIDEACRLPRTTYQVRLLINALIRAYSPSSNACRLPRTTYQVRLSLTNPLIRAYSPSSKACQLRRKTYPVPSVGKLLP